VGGKLFDLPRMPRAEYLAREAEIRAYLDRVMPGAYRIPRYHDAKADFGDMDVIVATSEDWGERRQQIAADLGITQVKIVGHVFSTVYRGLQTDFFAVPARRLDSMHAFMSFNDVGNIIGRMCRRFNLTWGEDGLSYVHRRASAESYRADLPVTQDFARVCAFLGLDHAPWVRGFADLDALFTWVTASPYFSVAPYLDAEISKPRPTIERFVAWLRERGMTQRPAFGDKASYLPQVIAAFPEADLAAQLAVEHAKEARAIALRAKWSGKLVMQLRPELQGAALGEFIQAFRASLGGPEAFEAWVLGASDDDIAARIRAFVVA
jgi:hypothetical protein